MVKVKAKSVDEYIHLAPKEARDKLIELRSILRSVAPNATENLKWGSPVFEEKRILFAYAAYKDHINFMPTRSAMMPFEKELAKFMTGKDTIQFPYDKKLPKTLIKKIAAYRYKEVIENDARWM